MEERSCLSAEALSGDGRCELHCGKREKLAGAVNVRVGVTAGAARQGAWEW